MKSRRFRGSGEALFIATIIGLAVGLPMFLLHDGVEILLFRVPWLDEVHTILLAERPILDLVGDLGEGADYNPPLLYMMLRPLALLGGGLAPVELRLFSLGCVLVAMNLFYWTVRGPLGPMAALAGSLLIWAHGSVPEQAYNGRFYAPMLALAALVAFSWMAYERKASPWRLCACGLAAIALCVVHYFGILVLSLMAAGRWIALPSRSDRNVTGAVWLAGVAATASLLPVFLGQRAALTVATWVAAPTPARALAFLDQFYGWILLGILLLAGILAAALTGRVEHPSRFRNLCGLAALSFFPILLVVFSFSVQSVLIERYAIVTTLGLATVLALGVSFVPRIGQVTAISIVLLGGLFSSARAVSVYRLHEDAVHEVRRLVHSAGPGPIVLTARHDLYPSLAAFEERVGILAASPEDFRSAFAGLNSDASDRFTRMLTVESDVARVHANLYGLPKRWPLAELRGMETFHLVDSAVLPVTLEFLAEHFFPEFEIVEVRGNYRRMGRLVRRPAP